MPPMNLKEQIATYLKVSGKKPYQLADEANVSRTSVYRFLNGERDLLLDTANKLKDQMELLYPEQSTVESGKQPVN